MFGLTGGIVSNPEHFGDVRAGIGCCARGVVSSCRGMLFSASTVASSDRSARWLAWCGAGGTCAPSAPACCPHWDMLNIVLFYFVLHNEACRRRASLDRFVRICKGLFERSIRTYEIVWLRFDLILKEFVARSVHVQSTFTVRQIRFR